MSTTHTGSEESFTRRIDTLKTLPRKNLLLFLALYNIHPALYFIMVTAIIGVDRFLEIGGIIIMLAPPIIIGFTVVYFIFNRKLKTTIDHLLNPKDNTDIKRLERFINSYAIKAALPLLAGCAGGPILTVIIGLYQGIFFSVQEAFFIALIGETTAAGAAFIMYYFTMVDLYPSNRVVVFRPLSMLNKLSVPIVSAILIIITLGTVTILITLRSDYSVTQKHLYEASLTRTTENIDSYFKNIISELNTFVKIKNFDAITSGAAERFLSDLHPYRDKNIEMYFYAYPDGTAPTSLNLTRNIKDRQYFKDVFEKGRTVISDPVVSKATNKEIIVLAHPVKTGDKVTGIIAVTILMDQLQDILKTASSQGEDILLVSDRKKISFSSTGGALKDKIIGEDIKSSDEGYRNMEALLAPEDGFAGEMIFSGKKVIVFGKSLASTGGKLIYLVDKTKFFGMLNPLMINMTLFLFMLTLIIYFIIRKISLEISRPIKNITAIFMEVARGNLAVKSDDYVQDEFGDLIIALKILLRRLKEIINTTVISSKQLSEASGALSVTSQALSASAQDQAASIEQATASLEETSGSIEHIAGSAKMQLSNAEQTKGSMNKLRDVMEHISGFAEEALKMATQSTEVAQKGSGLMKNTISGMDSISASTAKISEFVGLISDISDQVNLLSLNASIEAARAGDHGRGFAVVADEISKLADQTSSSAREISDLVSAGMIEVEKGKAGVDETSAALAIIVENIKRTDELVQKITSMSRDQRTASENVLHEINLMADQAHSVSTATDEQMSVNVEINRTINVINEATQAVASGASEVASSAEEISAQAESLYQTIGFFKTDRNAE
jgi:methyl-accepting chemotaxis protein